jgi:hypothetical protein
MQALLHSLGWALSGFGLGLGASLFIDPAHWPRIYTIFAVVACMVLGTVLRSATRQLPPDAEA